MSRAGAAILDQIYQGLMTAAAGLVFIGLELLLKFSVTSWITAIVIVAVFLINFGYYVFFEAAWNGQTPGKRSLRLRAVRVEGMPIDLPCAAIRSLIRIVDLPLIGITSMLVTKKNQRLGDLAAGTIVVKERSEWEQDIASPPAIQVPQYPEAAFVKNIELITPEQFETTKRFVLRRPELDPALQEQIAAKIAMPLMQHLGIEPQPQMLYGNFLTAIYGKCVEERGMR